MEKMGTYASSDNKDSMITVMNKSYTMLRVLSQEPYVIVSNRYTLKMKRMW